MYDELTELHQDSGTASAIYEGLVSQAGMLFGVDSACGTSCLNLSLISHLAAENYSTRIKTMVSLAWVEPDFHILTIAWLSQCNSILCLCQNVPQVNMTLCQHKLLFPIYN